MSEARNDTDDRALLAAAMGAEHGKHRGHAAAAEEPDPTPHGKHRRAESGEN